MDEPKSLDSLFKEKLFRVPDYQRGYAWQHPQLKDFWEDLINLQPNRFHYTGVLTLKEVDLAEVSATSKEHWLVEDHSFKLFHIVDGQQRLTTFVLFLQAFVESIKSVSENMQKSDSDLYITDSLNLAAVRDKYLYRIKPTGDQFRTYKFGYTEDNPSYDYLRYRVLNEPGSGSLQETFYTLNLSNALHYFREQLRDYNGRFGIQGMHDIYKSLTKRFLFNEYIIKNEFEVFVAFETMNNRGKKLSSLELLKNRLIYLTTLYSDADLDPSERRSVRETVNAAWKEVYHQLGRNPAAPLNDDEFLRAHWIAYFKYSRQTGRDYVRFLLEQQFAPQRVQRRVELEVQLEPTEELADDLASGDADAEDSEPMDDVPELSSAALQPTELRDFVNSLKGSASFWFKLHHPSLAGSTSEEEQLWLERLNRVGIAYFKPLVMVVLKKFRDEMERVHILSRIERFIFMVFRMTSTPAHYGNSEFYNLARELDRGETTIADIDARLTQRLSFMFNQDGTLRTDEFYSLLRKSFKDRKGYYGWKGRQYFLYEYELSLLSESVQKKVDWSDLLRTPKDKISIEHVYPQTETEDWAMAFEGLQAEHRERYGGSLGNLLLLSQAINSSLQNDSFANKKRAKYGASGQKIRNGYADGSHSEIEVSQRSAWGPQEILDRGMKMLTFMEKRWGFRFADEEQKRKLLFLGADQMNE